MYPYLFPTENNLKYKGSVPEYKYFDLSKVSLVEYLEYADRFKAKTWSLKNETLKYCVTDCISLCQILLKFCDLIWDTFEVDALKCHTLPSLAMLIFKTKYLDKLTDIPLLPKSVYDNLVQGYFGGHVDMYIPKGPAYPQGEEMSASKIKALDIAKLYLENGIEFIKKTFKTVKHYDINSLYPSVMHNFKFPTDIIGYFIGDITLIDNFAHLYDENLGIYKVKVTAPKIKHPLLPYRIKGTCVYPYGTWEGWYFSEEIKNAKKYGYKFEILAGYIFNSEFLFKDYVNALSAIKINSISGSPMYLIAKMLMNSLYGRFGLNPYLNTHSFVPTSEFADLHKKIGENILDVVDLGSQQLVTIKKQIDQDSRGLPANVAIALAVTAYARVVMSEFKNRDNMTLFYSDTDSLIVDSYLPDELVDNKKLGLYKLEAEYVSFIALGPKVYGAIDVNGKSYTKIKGFTN